MDSGPVVAHIAALRVTMSAERIAEVAGVATSTVHRLARGENPTSVRAIGEAILGVRPAPDETSAQEIRCLVDAGPARKALRQILAAGHTQAALARFTGRDPSTFSRLLHGKPMLHAEVAEVVLDARDRLVVRGRREGRRYIGARTVIDELIVAQLCAGTPTARPATPAEHAEAIRVLHGRGLYDREIGAVIGMSARNVVRIRHGKLALPAHPGSRRHRDGLEAAARFTPAA